MLASKNRMLGESLAFAPRNESLAYWLKINERLEIYELGSWEAEIQVTRDIIMQ